MILMDVKGLNWVGNVYHKFEALCLEVEEIMYQDTLKYVENQAENVGASFKRFYSDVMEDLVPPSTDGCKKSGDSDSPALNCTDTGRYRKVKTGIRLESSSLAVKKKSEDSEVVTEVHENAGHTLNLHRRRKVNDPFSNSYGDFAKVVSSNSISRKKTDACLYLNSNLGAKEKMHKESRGEKIRAMPPVRKKASAVSSLSKFSNTTASDSQMTASSVPASVEVASCDAIREKSLETEKAEERVSDISTESLSNDLIATVKSDMEKEEEFRHEDKCAINTVASPLCSLDHDDALCRVSSEEACESSAGRIDDKHLDAEASYMNITDEVVDAIKHDGEVNFEECVVVDEKELPFVPYNDGKQKVHKKGNRKVLYSRKNSSRQQEYEQLATWYGKAGVLNDCAEENPTVLEQEIKSPPTSEVCESDEWELL